MYRFLFLLAVGCFFAFSLVHTQKITSYDPFPNCTKQMHSNATKVKLAKCPPINYAANLTNPSICCKFWEGMSCQNEVYFTLPECQPARFLMQLVADTLKPLTCTPATSCPNVTTNEAVATVYENISPLMKLLENETLSNCSFYIEKDMSNCMVPFQTFMDGTPSDKDICCDLSNFQVCAQALTDKEASCAIVKAQLASAYKTMGENIAKKCPAGKFHCSKSGATHVSLAISLFTISLIIVALFA